MAPTDLKAAYVGVAMGKGGTNIARESAGLIITDDNFAYIVAGVEVGRIVYSNVQKVIFLLMSTGAAEVVLFLLARFITFPLPLIAVQLIWLNLVTNGIHGMALAFEPVEGDEMRQRPRPTREPIFNRIVLEMVHHHHLLLAPGQGMESLGEARNSALLLMVLFENLQVFNARSELRSAFSFHHGPP
jgi:magnesium-transporting ATPase (P-type)